MKTTQVIAALFPLAVMASSHSHESPSATTTPTSTTASAPGTTESPGTNDWKDLGCFKIIESNPKKTIDNLLAPQSNPVGFVGESNFNAKGSCAIDMCTGSKYAATQGNKCFCADELDTLTLIPTSAEDVCSIGCPGYDLMKCGGDNAITVYENTGGNGTGKGYPVDTTSETTLTYAPTSSGQSNGTASSTKTGSAPVTTKSGGPVEAGASSLVGQSVAVLVAVCGVGAALFL